jgi:hypothetical protein
VGIARKLAGQRVQVDQRGVMLDQSAEHDALAVVGIGGHARTLPNICSCSWDREGELRRLSVHGGERRAHGSRSESIAERFEPWLIAAWVRTSYAIDSTRSPRGSIGSKPASLGRPTRRPLPRGDVGQRDAVHKLEQRTERRLETVMAPRVSQQSPERVPAGRDQLSEVPTVVVYGGGSRSSVGVRPRRHDASRGRHLVEEVSPAMVGDLGPAPILTVETLPRRVGRL